MGTKRGQRKGAVFLVPSMITGIVLLLSWGVFWWSAFQIARIGRYREFFVSAGISFLVSIVCMIVQDKFKRSAQRHDLPADLPSGYRENDVEKAAPHRPYTDDGRTERRYEAAQNRDDADSYDEVGEGRNGYAGDGEAEEGRNAYADYADTAEAQDAYVGEGEAEENRNAYADYADTAEAQDAYVGYDEAEEAYAADDFGDEYPDNGHQNNEYTGNGYPNDEHQDPGLDDEPGDARYQQQGRRQASPRSRTFLILKVLEGILLGATAAIGVAGIVWCATSYHGWLAYKIHDLTRQKQVTYTHNNLYADGIAGIFTDITPVAGLPAASTLYIVGPQTINYDMDGTIMEIHLQLADKDAEGREWIYTISYRADQDENILVDTEVRAAEENTDSTQADRAASGNTGSEDDASDRTESETQEPTVSFTKEMILQPFLDLSQAMDLAGESLAYENASGQNQLQLIYYGYRSFPANEYTYYISQDGTRTHVTTASTQRQSASASLQTNDTAAAGQDTVAGQAAENQDTSVEQCEGYEISLHSSGVDEIVPARYFATWSYQEKE